MKTFYKVTCAAAAVLIGIGVLLGGIGLALGAHPSELFYKNGRHNGHYGYSWSGSRWWGGETVEATYENITELEFELGLSEVTILEGDTFSVKAERVNSKRFQSWQEGGTWKIDCPNEQHRGWFGWNNGWDSGKDRSPIITITVPKGFVARELELEMGMGTLTADGLSARESSVSVGMGEMILTNFTSGDCDVEVGMGTMTIDGKLTGDGSINCGMGTADLNLRGAEEDYGYTASVGMGDVEVGGESIGGLGGEISRNTGAPNYFEIDCGMGTVTIRFR